MGGISYFRLAFHLILYNGPECILLSPFLQRLLLTRLMGQYCFVRWCLLSVVVVCRRRL